MMSLVPTKKNTQIELMRKVVLSYPPLQERIAGDKEKTDQCLKNVEEIAATYNKSVMDKFQHVLNNTVDRMYEAINLTFTPEVGDFKKYVDENCVILVPNHQSHADYIALNYAIIKSFGFPVYIAGGINLNIFPIGTLFRNSGCFFIRRSFNNDILYKLTLEGYLYYLLGEGKPIEFFFEGGRSRSGKLLPPRYGLFTMLVTAHSHLPEKRKKPLQFMPVSIMHEYVPEQKSLTRELGGAKKNKESTKELLKVFKVLKYKLGSIHIKVGNGISGANYKNFSTKERAQKLAFDCFRSVGSKMMVTPTSLLALILLDKPDGALKFDEIFDKAHRIINYCKTFYVPITESLVDQSKLEKVLENALDMQIKNGKVDLIGSSTVGHEFYSIKPTTRIELLYFKNTILHHFIVPWIINSAWVALFSGAIESVDDLKKHFLYLRDQLKFEFYLPTVKETLYQVIKIISKTSGRKISTLEDCMKLKHKELMNIATELGVFARSCTYFTESYYIGALTLKVIYTEKNYPFKQDYFLKKSKEVFEAEKSLGRVIKYSESYSVPVIKNCLKFFQNAGVLNWEEGGFVLNRIAFLDKSIIRFEKELSDQIRFNMRG